MMKQKLILKIEGLSKQYRLGLIGTKTLTHDLNRWFHRVTGRIDPYLKIGEKNDRSTTGNSDYVWALKNINFEVEEGEVVGIIGKNGAGKSTLLKILSKVTSPSVGKVKLNGRIASLLEVGTGFHPEMTGRENVFLNGAILGMTKKEIKKKLDAIISFSGCERYIDTPVKRYSSGMTVRLAFAVAAHLEPDILVVDEVLAVGDIEFQKKAIGKMQDISSSEGRTVLFVSHNMAAIKNLCTRVMVLNNGELAFDGRVEEGLSFYKELARIGETANFSSFKNEHIELLDISVTPLNGKILSISSGIEIYIEFRNQLDNINLDCTVEIVNEDEVVIYHNGALVLDDRNSERGIYRLKAELSPYLLNSGYYKINLIFGKDQRYVILEAKDAFAFEVDILGSSASSKKPGILYRGFDWKSEFIENK